MNLPRNPAFAVKPALIALLALWLFGLSTCAPAAEEEYKLGAGDVLRISVFDEPDLLTETEVSESGTVGMPLIGEVAVGGMTRNQAAGVLSARLKSGGFLKEANVVVRVIEYRSQQISVLGEVGKPGKYSISKPSSITDMIAIAGGITGKGSNVVTVVRTGRDGTVQRQEVDVDSQVGARSGGKVLLLQAGDTVYVPVAPVFYIYGEVRQPGSYPLASNMTVMQALSVGGGLTVRGTERGIHVERRTTDGQVRAYTVKGQDKLQPNDVLRVPESWF
jgi:polysaccharide export outer membrane protein